MVILILLEIMVRIVVPWVTIIVRVQEVLTLQNLICGMILGLVVLLEIVMANVLWVILILLDRVVTYVIWVIGRMKMILRLTTSRARSVLIVLQCYMLLSIGWILCRWNMRIFKVLLVRMTCVQIWQKKQWMRIMQCWQKTSRMQGRIMAGIPLKLDNNVIFMILISISLIFFYTLRTPLILLALTIGIEVHFGFWIWEWP